MGLSRVDSKGIIIDNYGNLTFKSENFGVREKNGGLTRQMTDLKKIDVTQGVTVTDSQTH